MTGTAVCTLVSIPKYPASLLHLTMKIIYILAIMTMDKPYCLRPFVTQQLSQWVYLDLNWWCLGNVAINPGWLSWVVLNQPFSDWHLAGKSLYNYTALSFLQEVTGSFFLKKCHCNAYSRSHMMPKKIWGRMNISLKRNSKQTEDKRHCDG